MKLVHNKIVKRTRNDCWKSIRFKTGETSEHVWEQLILVYIVIRTGTEKPICYKLDHKS